MISRKENLLVRPWQERRYENHRRKVQSASPAIDNRPPAYREHVEVNLKKLQTEVERCHEIEKDNLLLLRKLNTIMKKNRVDNTWGKPQPTFLSRIKIFDGNKLRSTHASTESPHLESPKFFGRKQKCVACTPVKKRQIKIPEERVPWEPARAKSSRRSQSVPARKLTVLPTISEKKNESCEPKQGIKSGCKRKKSNARGNNDGPKETSQGVLISRGSLKLAVNFPPDSSVKFRHGRTERVLMNACSCKVQTPLAVVH